VRGESGGSRGNSPARIDNSPQPMRKTIPILLMVDESLDHIVILRVKPLIPTDINPIQIR
jgi:hypothetical protein